MVSGDLFPVPQRWSPRRDTNQERVSQASFCECRALFLRCLHLCRDNDPAGHSRAQWSLGSFPLFLNAGSLVVIPAGHVFTNEMSHGDAPLPRRESSMWHGLGGRWVCGCRDLPLLHLIFDGIMNRQAFSAPWFPGYLVPFPQYRSPRRDTNQARVSQRNVSWGVSSSSSRIVNEARTRRALCGPRPLCIAELLESPSRRTGRA